MADDQDFGKGDFTIDFKFKKKLPGVTPGVTPGADSPKMEGGPWYHMSIKRNVRRRLFVHTVEGGDLVVREYDAEMRLLSEERMPLGDISAAIAT